MLRLDHLTVISPSLAEGVAHVQDCLEIKVPFGTRHAYMGTHNHRLQLGDRVYLEIVALDPVGIDPGRARWFGVDRPGQVQEDWTQGRRLRGWVAATDHIEDVVKLRPEFGEVIGLPFNDPEFAFAIPVDGSLPSDGVLPSLIDHKMVPTNMSEIPDLGARLTSFTLEHHEPESVRALYEGLRIDKPPMILNGPDFRYKATIDTPAGSRVLW